MQQDVASLVHAAAEGDPVAWERIVARFGGLVWAIARAHGLSHSDAGEVCQTAWLRLVEHLHRIREPARLGAWLASTARHECLRTLKRAGRQVPVGDPTDLERYEPLPSGPAVDRRLLEAERDQALWHAFELLSERCRSLLRVLMADPAPSYEEVSEALGMPVGSIGPTRQRCLERLRRNAELVGISGEL